MNPRYGAETPHEPDDQDRELNEMFRRESANEERKIAEAGKLPADDELQHEFDALYASEHKKREDMVERLDLLNHTLKRFDDHLGSGLAQEMPLGEVIGFLEAKGEQRSAEAVIASLENGITAQTPLYQLIERFKIEQKEISKILHGENEEVDLEAD